MFDFVLEATTILALSSGVITGGLALLRHHETFAQFTIPDLFRGRFDAILYVIVATSTAFCLIDQVVGLVWLNDHARGEVPWKWRLVQMGVHSSIGVIFAGMHSLFDRLLDKHEFCALCRRKF